MCCLIDEPLEDTRGRYKTFWGANTFQVSICSVITSCPGGGFPCCIWFSGSSIPGLCGIAQYFLRRKVLKNDLSKYTCFQGYYNYLPCVKSGSCGESQYPEILLCFESMCCSSFAMSASRMYVMEMHDISSDPCDYRLIRLNNGLQMFSCFCDLLSIFHERIAELARIIDCVADVAYICVSGCITVQVSHEVDHQNSLKNSNSSDVTSETYTPVIPVYTGSTRAPFAEVVAY
jgi:hypothetical protein